MTDNFKIDDETLRAMYELDEYDPVEAFERRAAELAESVVDARDNFVPKVSNDQFLTAIFGDTFDLAYPLVCRKSGDPDTGGWTPICWPTDTSCQRRLNSDPVYALVAEVNLTHPPVNQVV